MRFVFKLLVLVLAILPAFADPADDEARALKWRDHALDEIAALKDFSERESAKKVAVYVGMAVGTDIRYFSGHRSEVFDAARKKLESMPGHGAFVEAELAELQEQHQERGGLHNYDYHRTRLFTVLRHLQTLESIELLIRLLEDNRDAETIKGPGVFHVTLGNDELAASALIGLVNELPLQKDRWGYYRKDVPTLRAWGREVMAGERTFQFKGKAGVYNIHGKIPEERREVLTGPPAPIAGAALEDEEKSHPSSVARWIAAVAVLVLLVAAARVLGAHKRNA